MSVRILGLLLCAVFLGPFPTQAAKLQEIKARGELLAGVKDSVAPFGYLDEATNQLMGFDVDLCRAIADKLGVRLRLVPVTSADRIPMLLQGSVDLVAATMTHSFARDEVVDFSITYFMDGQTLLVPKDSPIESVQDLAGKTVATAKGSTSEKNIKAIQPQVSVFSYETYPQAFLAMKRGEADAVTTDTSILLGLKQADENPEGWKLVGEPFSQEPYAVAVPENDSDFRDFINKALAEIWTSGHYLTLYNKWFGPDTNYHIPLTWEMEIWP